MGSKQPLSEKYLSELASVPHCDPNVVLRAFEADCASGKFKDVEGHWAAYVNGVFVKTGPDEDLLFEEIRREFGIAYIVIQPICDVQIVRMRSPRVFRELV